MQVKQFYLNMQREQGVMNAYNCNSHIAMILYKIKNNISEYLQSHFCYTTRLKIKVLAFGLKQHIIAISHIFV